MQLVNFKVKFFLIALIPFTLLCRSALRPRNSYTPLIITNWVGDTRKSYLRDSHLELYPLFGLYDEKHVKENLLPTGPITFRNDPSKSISGKELSDMIEHFVGEVKRRKRKFRDFVTLKARDFCRRKQAGLIVAKCKKYPFVVKLFLETPQGFVRPYQKGLEAGCIFTIGGGSCRHLLGFTRIKNLKTIEKRIKKNAHWSKRIDVPRKWFWLPAREPKMEVTAYNLGGHKEIKQQLPSVYAIIADEIKAERTFTLLNSDDKRTAIDLSNFLLCSIDPHINNFMVEEGTGKIVIIDTEHFPSLVGLKKRPRITYYSSFYMELTTKFVKSRFFRNKKERIRLQTNPTTPFSTV